jgi:hypothetical protein
MATPAGLADGGAFRVLFQSFDRGLHLADHARDGIKAVLGLLRGVDQVGGGLVRLGGNRAHLVREIVNPVHLLLLRRDPGVEFRDADGDPEAHHQCNAADNCAGNRQYAVIFARNGVHI